MPGKQDWLFLRKRWSVLYIWPVQVRNSISGFLTQSSTVRYLVLRMPLTLIDSIKVLPPPLETGFLCVALALAL